VIYPGAREVAAHEASHGAALIAQGIVPLLVRTDRPADNLLGSVKLDWDEIDPRDRITLRKILIGVLAGPLQDREPQLTNAALATDWPIDPDVWDDGNHADAKVITVLIDLARLDQIDYLQDVARAKRLGKDRRYRRLMVALTDALEDRELLVKHELQELAATIPDEPSTDSEQ
jgi:hypothetical protein